MDNVKIEKVGHNATATVRYQVMSEARFLAGEDARGMLVVLEPETELSSAHLSALADCGASGFISDGSADFFERPDVAPTLAYDRERFADLKAFAVSPRHGVRLRTHAAQEGKRFVILGADGSLSPEVAPAPAKRDRLHDPEITKDEIVAKLRELGVEEGDTLMVHSSLSACGHLAEGAKTIIDALIETVGENGNFFLPSFQRSETFLNGAVSHRWDHRPADVTRRDSEAVRWVGTLPLEFMRLYPEAPRGVQISHSWTGWGKRAAAMLAVQVWNDPPFGARSLPMQVKADGGKILHFGTPICRTSFLHCLEDALKLPGYSATGFFEYRRPDGTIAWTALQGSFCGSRISSVLNEAAPLYQEAFKEGLEIAKVKLGVGTLMLLDCDNYWNALAKVFAREPSINLGK